MAADVENKSSYLIQAMLKGLQFDNNVVAYIVSLPLVCLSILALCNKIPRKMVIGVNTFFMALNTLTFAISISDIPYFTYFFAHLGVASFNWIEFGGATAGLIFQAEYFLFFAIFAVSVALFIFSVIRLGRQLLKNCYTDLKKTDYWRYIPLTILLWGACFTGIRGSFQQKPLQPIYAYFSNYSFFNQLGINPCFSLLKSLETSLKHDPYSHVNDQMPVDSAFLMVSKELEVEMLEDTFSVAREVKPQGEIRTPNIIIIFLESMSAKYLEYDCEDGKLAPFFHELISKSYYFENCYSSGIHTNNGIVSTLYGLPALFDKHSMKNELRYTGMPVILHRQGYLNLFFLKSARKKFCGLRKNVYRSNDKIVSFFNGICK